MAPVRIGVLGAAKIAPAAVVKPARANPEAVVASIAARDPQRAAQFARKHGVPTVHPTYDALLADPDVDAVYIPLPNGLHAEWTLRAIDAGKHVLCEKPMTANAAEAEQVADAAERSGLVVMEAFHYRYHPLAARMVEIVHGGELGAIRRIESWLCFPLPMRHDIRWRYDLGGGALMDGCYALHAQRLLGAGEPEVVGAHALLREPRVDRAMSVDLRHADGAVGRAHASMWSQRVLKVAVRVVGDRGEMRVTNFVAPQLWHRLVLRVDGRTTRSRMPGDATYAYQLRAFTAAVLRGEPVLTPAADAVPTMRLIDDAYRAAGLPLRGMR